MTAALARVHTLADLFHPVDESSLAGLFADYASARQTAERLADTMAAKGTAAVLPFFIKGNQIGERYSATSVAETLFGLPNALKALDAAYWQRALDLTDVWEVMPQKRRDEWNASIEELTCPTFEPRTVVNTLQGMLADRQKFFSEKIDGCFRELSGEHVTNRPEGFSRRMIYSGIHNGWYVDYRRAGYVHDLRTAVAKFMGRDAPSYHTTDKTIQLARNYCGQWLELDGGAVRMRLYKKGTAHIEVHPDLAWRLNEVLALMHPRAIPSKWRQPPKRKPKTRELFSRLIPAKVLDALQSTLDQANKENGRLELHTYKLDRSMARAVGEVLGALGAVKDGTYLWVFEVFTEARTALRFVIASGEIPDHRAYQFYPTPKAVREYVREQSQVEDHHTCLEPSAGFGALASLLPKDTTTCVELSRLHAEVLREQRYRVACCDFLEWVDDSPATLFDRIVMNPPFAGGQARAHLDAASARVKLGGRLVAVLPVSFAGLALDRYACTYSEPFDNEFAGTSISVVVLTAVRNE